MDIYKTFQSKEEEIARSFIKPVDYSTPYMVLVPTGSKTVLDSTHNHWVIRVDDFVIDPARGVFKAKDFDRVHGHKEVLNIKVPPK